MMQIISGPGESWRPGKLRELKLTRRGLAPIAANSLKANSHLVGNVERNDPQHDHALKQDRILQGVTLAVIGRILSQETGVIV